MYHKYEIFFFFNASNSSRIAQLGQCRVNTNFTVAKLFLSVYFLLRMYYYSFYKQWVIRGEKMIDL